MDAVIGTLTIKAGAESLDARWGSSPVRKKQEAYGWDSRDGCHVS